MRLRPLINRVICFMALPINKPYCIYIHLKLCGEVFYVGIGSTLKRPFSKTYRNKFWQRLVKRNPNYEVRVLKENITKEFACELETVLIDWYGRRDIGKGTLVNLTDGGESTYGRVMEQWQKDKLSSDRIGTMTGVDNPNYGNKWDQKQKERMSVVQKEKYANGEYVVNMVSIRKGIEERTRRIKEIPGYKEKMAKAVSDSKSLYDYLMIDYITGEILEEFSTYMNLKEKYPKVGKTVINSVCNGHKVSYRGYLWRYKSKETGEIIVPDLKKHNGYKVYYKSNDKTYLRMTDAAKDDILGYSAVRSRFNDVNNEDYKVIPITHPYL